MFLVGFSTGTYPTNFFGCYRGSVIRALASLSGGFYDAENDAYGAPAASACASTMPAYVAHGTADGTVQFQWGEDTRDDYAARDGCTTSTTAATLDPASCVSYEGCTSGTSLVWCTHPGDHVITDFERSDT